MDKVVTICKTGSDHLYSDRNRQDFVVNMPGVKVVLDGCGSTPFSDVGVALFGQLLSKKCDELTLDNFENYVREIFMSLVSICPGDDEFRTNNLSFTILACFETEDEFVVLSCGDGYIITQKGDVISYLQLDDGEYPKYYVYNYILDKSSLNEYQSGVEFSEYHFDKLVYDNVGVATDGLRFKENLDNLDNTRFSTFLYERKNGKMAMLINRNSSVFKDDISICF